MKEQSAESTASAPSNNNPTPTRTQRLSMLRSQRILVGIGSLCIALLLNLSFCDWKFRDPPEKVQPGGLTTNDWQLRQSMLGYSEGGGDQDPFTGLIARKLGYRINYETGKVADPYYYELALVLGIIVPACLLFTGIYFTFGRSIKHRRVLIVACLLSTAFLLHVSLCDWKYRADASRAAILVFVSDNNTPDSEMRMTGIFGQHWGSRRNLMQNDHKYEEAVIFGLVVPVVLVFSSGYLMLGWRIKTRIEHGLCEHCAYDLRATIDAGNTRCPECGHRINSTYEKQQQEMPDPQHQ